MQHNVNKANTPIALGTVGIQKSGVMGDYFNTTGIPAFEKIRVVANTQSFTPRTFDKYIKSDPKNLYNIKFVDSLDPKPKYLNFKFIDHINLLKQINANKELVSYIKNQPEAHIVNELSMIVSKNDINEITSAEALFLNSTNSNEYVIELHKENKTYKTIKFSLGSILGYNISSFCWGTDHKGKQTIVEITPENSRCPKNTSKSLKKEKEQNIKKFTKL